MGGDTLPNAYDTAIKVENILIQVGKLAPRPPMPFFPDVPNHQPAMAPLPTTSTSQFLTPAPQDATYSNGIDEIKEMMQSMMQNFSVIDKRLQGQERKLEDSFFVIDKRLQGQEKKLEDNISMM